MTINKSRIESETDIEFLIDGRHAITVFKPQEKRGAMEKAQINWSGCGSQDITTTQIFITLLKMAIEEAVKQNRIVGLS